MDRKAYCSSFDEVRTAFRRDVERFGVPIEPVPSCARDERADGPWSCENAGCSLRRGWISPACLACRTGMRTATFFVSLRCRRNCYFCFNPNQRDYRRFLREERDIVAELRAAHAQGAEFDCLAITGGEPFLHAEAVLAFLREAKKLYPRSHVRIYTSGDSLDGELLERLRDVGLDELRFSIKLDDDEQVRENVLATMELAVGVIPAVMVEMPVIPGTLEEMEGLLVRIDRMGVKGINLLEFCFPLHNVEEFKRRGFRLRRRPFRILYDYWYGGGVPVAGSEQETLELLRFAERKGLRLGVHYCSSDNKNSGQVFQQNLMYFNDEALRGNWGFLALDTQDYYLKCAKAFGDRAHAVAKTIERLVAERGALLRDADFLQDDFSFAEDIDASQRWSFDASVPQVSFPMTWLPLVQERVPDCEFAVSYFVLENAGGKASVRELDCVPLEDEAAWRKRFLD